MLTALGEDIFIWEAMTFMFHRPETHLINIKRDENKTIHFLSSMSLSEYQLSMTSNQHPASDVISSHNYILKTYDKQQNHKDKCSQIEHDSTEKTSLKRLTLYRYICLNLF